MPTTNMPIQIGEEVYIKNCLGNNYDKGILEHRQFQYVFVRINGELIRLNRSDIKKIEEKAKKK